MKQNVKQNKKIVRRVAFPENVDALLNDVLEKNHTSRRDFILDAVMEKLEDMLDIEMVKIELAKKEKAISHEEAKRILGLAD